HIAASAQADLVALDVGDETARDEMVMFLVPDAAVGADQLDPVLLDAVDGADVNAVGADHFHMLADILEAAHGLLLAGWNWVTGGSTLRSRRWFSDAAPDYACFAHESSGAPGCSLHQSRLATRPYARRSHRHDPRRPDGA